MCQNVSGQPHNRSQPRLWCRATAWRRQGWNQNLIEMTIHRLQLMPEMKEQQVKLIPKDYACGITNSVQYGIEWAIAMKRFFLLWKFTSQCTFVNMLCPSSREYAVTPCLGTSTEADSYQDHPVWCSILAREGRMLRIYYTDYRVSTLTICGILRDTLSSTDPLRRKFQSRYLILEFKIKGGRVLWNLTDISSRTL